jgi:hypothetical protein
MRKTRAHGRCYFGRGELGCPMFGFIASTMGLRLSDSKLPHKGTTVPPRLHRYQASHHLHFLTFSCQDRLLTLNPPKRKCSSSPFSNPGENSTDLLSTDM